jgi:hypothetical protein
LENGANPNAQNNKGQTPLMHTVEASPGAAKFLIEWPTTDVNVRARTGMTVLALVRDAIKNLQRNWFMAMMDGENEDEMIRQGYLLSQWCEIEKMPHPGSQQQSKPRLLLETFGTRKEAVVDFMCLCDAWLTPTTWAWACQREGMEMTSIQYDHVYGNIVG